MFSIGLSEVALRVTDLKASIRFYRDVVGLRLEGELEDLGAIFLAATPDQHQRVILFAPGYRAVRQKVALPEEVTEDFADQMRKLASEEKVPPPPWEHVHFAFHVPRERLAAAVDYVRGKGIEVTGPVHFAYSGFPKSTSYYFRDPDGHHLEFWPPDPA